MRRTTPGGRRCGAAHAGRESGWGGDRSPSGPTEVRPAAALSLACCLAFCLPFCLAFWPAPACAEDADLDQLIVTAPTRTADPAGVDGAAIRATGAPDLLGALARNIAGVSLEDAQGDPFQPTLVFHGYAASGLQGSAQGLAVYLDGVRFNQPFGDTVDFDLLPEAAIDHLSLEAADPVYGLNALGGAVVATTRTGRTFAGAEVAADVGDHGRRDASAEFGARHAPWSAYLALEARHDGGWRRHSPARVDNAFADLGYDGARAGAHLKLIGADSDLTGNGSAPVELLAADRRAVFTWPDTTKNRFGRISLHPWAALSDATRLDASLYLQRLNQATVNGDTADVAPCEAAEDRLCLSDATGAESPLLDAGADPIPARLPEDAPYGVLNRSRTGTTAGGGLLQVVDRRRLNGGENRLVLGASYDLSRTGFTASTELGALTDDRAVAGLGPVIAQPDGSIAPVSITARTRDLGLFASERLPLGPRLSLEGSLRYNLARVSLDDRLGGALDGRHAFARLNPGLEARYAVSPALNLRLGYAETNRAPTPAELSCAGPDQPCSFTNFFVADPDLKQVVARHWSVATDGGGAVLGWRLDWRLAAWRSTNRDDIQFVASGVRGRAFFANTGQTRRQGLDASLSAAHGRWSGRLAYALVDATFLTRLRLNSPDNPAADEDGTIAVVPGDRLPGIPRHRATLVLDYTGERFTLGGDLQAQSGQVLFGDEGNDEPQTGAFAVVGLHGGLRLTEQLWAFAEVSNLLDHRFATFGSFSETADVFLAEAPGAADPRSLGPGAPRRFKLGLRARF